MPKALRAAQGQVPRHSVVVRKSDLQPPDSDQSVAGTAEDDVAHCEHTTMRRRTARALGRSDVAERPPLHGARSTWASCMGGSTKVRPTRALPSRSREGRAAVGPYPQPLRTRSFG